MKVAMGRRRWMKDEHFECQSHVLSWDSWASCTHSPPSFLSPQNSSSLHLSALHLTILLFHPHSFLPSPSHSSFQSSLRFPFSAFYLLFQFPTSSSPHPHMQHSPQCPALSRPLSQSPLHNPHSLPLYTSIHTPSKRYSSLTNMRIEQKKYTS